MKKSALLLCVMLATSFGTPCLLAQRALDFTPSKDVVRDAAAYSADTLTAFTDCMLNWAIYLGAVACALFLIAVAADSFSLLKKTSRAQSAAN